MKNENRIIVIGASAGGVQALQQLAATLSPDIAAPILVVLHIGAHRSQLPDLLAGHGRLPAVFAESGMIPEAGTIYMAPPDHHLLLENGRLNLFKGPKEHFSRPAIDPLFRSAALHSGNAVIGVILTGMLEDGSAGLDAIKACGGTTVVQDPSEAVQASMPRSAISATAVDHVVRLDAMADLLKRLSLPVEQANANAPDWLRVAHAISLGHGDLEELGRIGTSSGFTCPDCGGSLFELKHGALRYLCHTGHAFSLLSLVEAHDVVTEELLWSGLRALQEKETLLRHLAATQAADDPACQKDSLAEADDIAALIAQMW
ncbi:MAG TPA: chemotaxis protein CheB [Polaromonas sp.]|uniref:chemotaxis protein CheB n=1 Tax=Polaromonas sp. TaxID=1869339 RepID=UPI002D62E237|nr:chemotaxis protein CheB [Polaromonas sp.]HYW57149.1 chemotaxis protein CheB [Polaromonas sp.]